MPRASSRGGTYRLKSQLECSIERGDLGYVKDTADWHKAIILEQDTGALNKRQKENRL